MEPRDEELDPRTGLLGELEVEMQLVQNRWHPVRLDTAQMASNADLIAVNRRLRVAVQVKTSSDAKWLNFGYATAFLRDGTSFFNSKRSPLIADVVVGVRYSPTGSRFVVMPVALAESLCRFRANYWYGVPKRGGKERSMSFPLYLPLSASPKPHAKHWERVKRNVLPFENAWHILKEPIDKLHDAKAWPLLR